MNNIFSPKKHQNNSSIREQFFDFHFKSKIKKNNNELFQSKKSDRTNNNEENSVKLSHAYKNINLMLSNCLESIRADNQDNETINNIKSPLFYDINNLFKKKSKDISNDIEYQNKLIIFH